MRAVLILALFPALIASGCAHTPSRTQAGPRTNDVATMEEPPAPEPQFGRNSSKQTKTERESVRAACPTKTITIGPTIRGAPMRSLPSLQTERFIIGYIPDGEVLCILAESIERGELWDVKLFKVRYGGVEGWVSEYFTTDAPAGMRKIER